MLHQGNEPRYRTEGELRTAILHLLRSHGIPVRENVPCAAGIADLVVGHNEIIYECKLRLTRIALQQAMGQLQLYQASLNPNARLIVIGYATSETATLIPYLASLGIQVLPWKDRVLGAEEGGLGDRGRGSELVRSDQIAHTQNGEHSATPFPRSQLPAHISYPPPPIPRSLRWNVATLSQARGLKNAPALAERMGTIRQAVYEIWKGDSGQVQLDVLSKLCWALDAEPGAWFCFGAIVEGQRHVIWNVAEQAAVRDLRMIQLSRISGVDTRSLGPIWHGTAKAVQPHTLARIAIALHAIQPFAIGDLFVWNTYPEPINNAQ